jgi:ectoine hydroxylase-related dioxygenase (phytanoyl-CoA dioxygenase family)
MAAGKHLELEHADFLNYAARGYHIARGLFSSFEFEELAAHYMEINRQGPHPGDFAGVPRRTERTLSEPLTTYPRLIQMHEWDACSAAYMNDSRLMRIAADLIGQQPLVLQTMVYFKPPGSRGQSFHQDNLYLRTTPVIAAWVALDNCDRDNGAMEMVEGSHLLGLLPCRAADTNISFTDSETILPTYLNRQIISMEPGDVVFFGGLTVHGSAPNTTNDRFRRAFIVHYQGTEHFPIVGPALPTAEAK